jgi:hypothetical protein
MWKITWIKGHTDDPGAEELRMFPDCYYEVQQAADILARDALPHQHYPCGLVDRWFARVQLAATTQAMLADWWVYRKQVDPLFGGCDISTRTNMPTEDEIYQGLGDDNEPQLVYFDQEEEDQIPFDICDLDGNPIPPTIPPPWSMITILTKGTNLTMCRTPTLMRINLLVPPILCAFRLASRIILSSTSLLKPPRTKTLKEEESLSGYGNRGSGM